MAIATAKRNLLLRIYTALPYLFFTVVAVCFIYSELAWGGISWQNHSAPYATGYEVFSPVVDIILFPTVAGMLLLPVILLVKLLFKPRSGWRKWLPALFSYTLFLCFFTLSVYMGWYID